MAGKSRVPMQVAPEFDNRIKELQQKIMKKHGRKISYRDLTEKIAKTPNFDELEKSILNVGKDAIKINFDRRSR